MGKKYRLTKGGPWVPEDEFCDALVREIKKAWPGKTAADIIAELDEAAAKKESFMEEARKRLKNK